MMPTDGTKVQCQIGGGGGVENENWALLFEFTNVAEIEFKTC